MIVFSSFPKISKYLYGDLPTHHPDEHDQPGHQLHDHRGQVQPDHHSEHHLHDGPDICVSLSVLLPPPHALNQAGGGVAPSQPGLPLPGHHHKHHSSCKLDYKNNF